MSSPPPVKSRYALTADQQRQREEYEKKQIQQRLAEANAARELAKQVGFARSCLLDKTTNNRLP